MLNNGGSITYLRAQTEKIQTNKEDKNPERLTTKQRTPQTPDVEAKFSGFSHYSPPPAYWSDNL